MADATQAAFTDAMRQALLAATLIAVVTATVAASPWRRASPGL